RPLVPGLATAGGGVHPAIGIGHEQRDPPLPKRHGADRRAGPGPAPRDRAPMRPPPRPPRRGGPPPGGRRPGKPHPTPPPRPRARGRPGARGWVLPPETVVHWSQVWPLPAVVYPPPLGSATNSATRPCSSATALTGAPGLVLPPETELEGVLPPVSCS